MHTTRIVTVLRSGGDFRPGHVQRLQAQCARFAPGVPFLCLSDMEIPGVEVRKLEWNWPGWWSKIEAFKLQGPILYMDLDTTIVGPLEDLLDVAASRPFVALKDFLGHGKVRDMGSGLMAWSGSMHRLHDLFAVQPDKFMAECQTPRAWGDQGYIEPRTVGRKYWQDELPGAVVSYKQHCRNGVPAGARVVCFHGKPRPWELPNEL